MSSAAAAGQYLIVTTTADFFVTNTQPLYSVSPYYTINTFTEYYAWFTIYTTVTANLGPDTYPTTLLLSFTELYPDCTLQVAVDTHPPGSCGRCTFAANQLQLIYFPVTTGSSESTSTAPQIDASLLTGYFDGTPYTSGSVYLKYEKVSATDPCGLVGGVYTGAVITLASDEVSSLIGDGTVFFSAKSFNFADLQYPVPESVYIGACGRDPLACVTQHEGGYLPFVSLPPQIRGLDPL